MMSPPPPYFFPPSVFYARQIDEDTIEMIGVDFEWDYWDRVSDDPYEEGLDGVGAGRPVVVRDSSVWANGVKRESNGSRVA